jgi:hypothetical protein
MKVPLDRMPPFLCRAYAHVSLGGGHTRPKKVGEIARDSRLSLRSVKRISRRTTWAGMRVSMAFQFAEACGVNLMSPTRAIKALRRPWARAHWRHNERYELFYSKLFAEMQGKIKTGASL